MATRKKAASKKKAKKPVNFYVWLRSGLRSLSRKWPPVYEALAAAKVPYEGPNKRRQWSYKCAMCGELHESKNVACDHIEPAGSLLCKGDVGDFVERLFCPVSSLQVLCSQCHSLKTYVDRYGGTLEEAKTQLEIVRLMRKENKKELLELLQKFNYNNCTNDTKRKAALTEIFTKEKMNDSM